jgi:hypothetical protein
MSGGPFYFDDIVIDEAAEFPWAIQWKAGTPATVVDMSAATAVMKIRETDESASAAVSLTTGGGGITLDAQGNIKWSLTAAQTVALVGSLPSREGVWDIIITFGTAPPQYPNQKVFKFARGAVRLQRSAARA